MKIGDIVYHPHFRREEKSNFTGIILKIVETGYYGNVDVFVQWDDGVKEWYSQSELSLEGEQSDSKVRNEDEQ